MKLLSQESQEIKNSQVVVRCNFDVPIKDGQVTDTTRIEDAQKTIHLLLKNQNQITLIAHLGRPKGKPDLNFSLKPVIPILQKLISLPIEFIEYSSFSQEKFTPPSSQISLLENLRFWPEEKENQPAFSKKLSHLGRYYVNESFATSHRKHASIVGIPTYIPGLAGISLENEVTIISKVKKNPTKPLVLVMGGAKLETKEPLIQEFSTIADQILVGGKLALDIESHHIKQSQNVNVAKLVSSGKDITPESAQTFADIINSAGTVIWNGSMGVFEESEHQQGTQAIAAAVNTTPAFTLVGGGDTEAALSLLNLEDGIDHISNGGGAMLDLLIHNTLPGIQAL